MTFEEEFLKEFPSTKHHVFHLREYCRTCVCFVAEVPQENHEKHEKQINHYMRIADVKEYCLDKEKVRKVIEMYPFVQTNVTISPHDVRRELKEKLGLK